MSNHVSRAVSSVFQSTLSMRRATFAISYAIDFIHISIHALHEESDRFYWLSEIHIQEISIHALHEESDHSACRVYHVRLMDFNPRSP